MDFMNHHKWLVESNLLTDEMKDNVAMAAYVIIEDVIDASTFIDFENYIVNYRLLLPEALVKNLELLRRYENGDSIGFFEMRRLKKFLIAKKAQDESGMGYKLESIADAFIKTYLNDKWKTKVEFKSVKNYDGKKNLWLHSEDYPRSN